MVVYKSWMVSRASSAAFTSSSLGRRNPLTLVVRSPSCRDSSWFSAVSTASSMVSFQRVVSHSGQWTFSLLALSRFFSAFCFSFSRG